MNYTRPKPDLLKHAGPLLRHRLQRSGQLLQLLYFFEHPAFPFSYFQVTYVQSVTFYYFRVKWPKVRACVKQSQ